MKLSPNEPCHCGTGKKYKKCCMLKDEQAARAAAAARDPAPAAPAAPPPAPPLPVEEPAPSPEEEHWDALIAAFDEAALPRKLEMIRETIDAGSIDGETAYEFLHRLLRTAIGERELSVFDEAVSLIQQRAPETFDEERIYINELQLEAALISGKTDRIEPLAMATVEAAPAHFELLRRAMGLLEFRGELDLCVRMAEAAWPLVRESDDLLEWAIDHFANRCRRLLLLAREARDGAKSDFDDELRQHLEAFGDCDLEAFGSALDHLSGRTGRQWTMRDLDIPAVPQPVDPPKQRKDPRRRERERNLSLIGFAFVGWARREEGIPLTLANAGMIAMQDYLLDRGDARLGPGVSVIDRMLNSGKLKAVRPYPPPDHVLCPDAQTLDTFVGRQMNLFDRRHAEAAAFVTIIPPWLRFLESHGLIDASRRDRSTVAIAELSENLRKMYSRVAPALLESFGAWDTA